ncbi:MAG: cell division protein FtsL [Gammaproteobacteria bacterium]|nr:cell division protein FtsL [Gammaproteobacteria bacterium]
MMLKIVSLSLLVVIVMSSAIAVIYTKHSSRKLFVELQQINKNIDELNVEWGRLQLEEGAWSDHGRVEKVARTKLNMSLPGIESVVYLKP